MHIPDPIAEELRRDLAEALRDFASRDPIVRLAGVAEMLDVVRRMEEALNAGGSTDGMHARGH